MSSVSVGGPKTDTGVRQSKRLRNLPASPSNVSAIERRSKTPKPATAPSMMDDEQKEKEQSGSPSVLVSRKRARSASVTTPGPAAKKKKLSIEDEPKPDAETESENEAENEKVVSTPAPKRGAKNPFVDTPRPKRTLPNTPKTPRQKPVEAEQAEDEDTEVVVSEKFKTPKKGDKTPSSGAASITKTSLRSSSETKKAANAPLVVVELDTEDEVAPQTPSSQGTTKRKSQTPKRNPEVVEVIEDGPDSFLSAPKTPAKAPQTPGKKQPQTPGPKTPGKVADPEPVVEAEAPKTPAKAPQTPGKKQPQTPGPKTPAKVIEAPKVLDPAPIVEAEAPKTPAKAPQTPGKKQPQTPSPKTPAKVIEAPKTPAKVADPAPVVEAEAPKTPAKAPQTPGKKQPQTPGPKTPAKVIEAPKVLDPEPIVEAEAPKTPAKAPQTPGKKQPAPKTPAKVIEAPKIQEPEEHSDYENTNDSDDDSDDAPESVSAESAKQSIVDSRRAQLNQINKLKQKKKELLRSRQEKDIERKKNLLPTNILNAIANLPQDNEEDEDNSESDDEPTKPQNTRQTFSDDDEDDDLFGDPYALVSSDEEGNVEMKSSGSQTHGLPKASGKTTTSLLKVKNQAGINVAFLKANTKNSALLPTSQLNPASAGESFRSAEFIKSFQNPLSAQRTKFRPTQQGSSRKSKTNTTKLSAKLGVFSKSSFSTF